MNDDDGAFTISAFRAWAHVGRTLAYELRRGEARGKIEDGFLIPFDSV